MGAEALTSQGFDAIAFRYGVVCVVPEGPEAQHERPLAHASETPVEFRVVHVHAQASHNRTLSERMNVVRVSVTESAERFRVAGAPTQEETWNDG